MARRMRSDPKADVTAATIKRKSADAKFAAAQKKPAATPLLDAPKTHLAMATDEQAVVVLGKVMRAQEKFEKAKANAKEITSEAKSDLEEAKTSAVAALVSRSISRRSLERMMVLEKRRRAKGEAEVTAEIKGETWMLRACGFEVGEQLTLFDTAVKDQKDALARAHKQGLEVGARAGAVTENPFHPGTEPGQRWLQGYHDAQTINASKIGQTPKAKAPTPAPSAKVTNLADVKAKRAKHQEKRGALPPVPAVVAEQPKRGRGRPKKVQEAKEGDVVDDGSLDPSEMKHAAE